MNKRDVVSGEDIEKYYSQCRKIKLTGEAPKTTLDAIITMITPGPNNCTTYSKGGRHCKAYKARSIDDLIKVVKFYFPDTTVKDIFNEIINFERGLDRKQIAFTYCPHISKHNFHGISSYHTGFEKKIVSSISQYGFDHQNFPNCKVRYSDLIIK